MDRSAIDAVIDSAALYEGGFKHYGVKGMRWGVRRKRTSTPATADASRTTELVSKARSGGGTRVLSNSELRTAIERMNLEQQYDRLRPKTGGEKVRAWVANTLLNIGKEQASTVARNYASEQIKEALKK